MGTNRYQIHFVSPDASHPNVKSPTNRKAVEVARSQARSHAARFSYPRTQRKSVKVKNASVDRDRHEPGKSAADPSSQNYDLSPPGETATRSSHAGASTTTLPINLKFRLHVAKPRAPWSAPETADNVKKEDDDETSVQPSPSLAKLPKNISKSALDPFVGPALDLSVPDEHLLHLCRLSLLEKITFSLMGLDLTTVPDQIYGSTTSPVASTARHSTLGVVATNPIVVMWLLLVIESEIVSFQPTKKDRQLSIWTRRSLVYRCMNARLAHRDTATMDDFILAVAIAGGCEHRMGNTSEAKQHVKAAKDLLELRGGIKAVRNIAYPLNLMVVNVFVENGIQGLWRSQVDLERETANLWKWLRDVQLWSYEIRNRSAPASISINSTDESFKSSPPASPTNIEEDRTDADYLFGRARAFRPGSALFDYVHVPSEDLDDAQCRFFLGVLYAINSAIWAFRKNNRASTAYFKGLITAAEMSAPSNLTLRAGGAKLPSLLMMVMIAHHAVDAADRDELTSTVFHVEKIFEFVEMVMMAGLKSRTTVIRALSSWLTAGATDVRDLVFISNSTLDILAGEVEDKWFSDRPG